MISQWRRRLVRRIDAKYFDPLILRVGEANMAAQRAGRGHYRALWDAEVRVYSQSGEDGILDYLCDVTGIAKPRVLELGAGTFEECNGRFLAVHRGAAVVAVDAQPELTTNIQQLPWAWTTLIHPIQGWITPDTAPEFLATARQVMGGVDIVSLDIDGNDYWVAESLDLTDVQIVVVEYNPLFGPHRAVSVERNDRFDRRTAHFSWLYFGASLSAWIGLFEERGFVFVGTNRWGNNAFFCRPDSLGALDFHIPDIDDLSPYTDWRVRESRDSHGELSYLYGPAAVEAIASLPVVEIDSQSVISVEEGWQPRT